MMQSAKILVPGKIMLAGEYAVLNGGRALAATISKGMVFTITTEVTDQPGFKVISDYWEKPIQVVSPDKIISFTNNPLCETVAFAMHYFAVPQGQINVTSELDVTHGVGTSAAIRLGVLLCFREFAESNKNCSDLDLARLAYELQKQSQSVASGYDIITQMTGGLLTMQPPKLQVSIKEWPGQLITHETKSLETIKSFMHVFVGGKGAPTEPVAKKTLQWIDKNNLSETLYTLSENLINQFNQFFIEPSEKNKNDLVSDIANQRKFFEPSPCFPSYLGEKLKKVDGCDKNWSFKTTGAGGEDALLVFGEKQEITAAKECLAQLGWTLMPYEFSFDKARRL